MPKSAEPKLTSSNVLFCSANSLKHKSEEETYHDKKVSTYSLFSCNQRIYGSLDLKKKKNLKNSF